MKFIAKTEEQLIEESVMPKGKYPFEVSYGEDTTSKAGNEMIKLLVRVFKEDGTFNLVNDYLLESMQFKLLHCAEACGLSKEYESGELTGEMFVGKQGMLELSVRPAGDYPAQNQIKDYIVPKEGEEKKEPPKNKGADIEEDEIPF